VAVEVAMRGEFCGGSGGEFGGGSGGIGIGSGSGGGGGSGEGEGESGGVGDEGGGGEGKAAAVVVELAVAVVVEVEVVVAVAGGVPFGPPNEIKIKSALNNMDIQPPQSTNSYREVRYKERGHMPNLRSWKTGFKTA
jgi:hypothetical protein